MLVLFQADSFTVPPMWNVSLHLSCVLAYLTNLKSFHNVIVCLRAIYNITDPSVKFFNI